MPNIKYILFDAMGVIFETGDDTNELLVPFVQQRNPMITSAEINAHYLRASLGEISPREFWTSIGLADNYPAIEREYLDSCLVLDSDFCIFASRMKQRYKIGLLSNDVSEWSAYLRRKHKLAALFDTVVVSGDAGYRKPDRRIYELTIDKLDCSADECVFIDDRVKNLHIAREVGMMVIKFRRPGDNECADGITEISEFGELVGVLRQYEKNN